VGDTARSAPSGLVAHKIEPPSADPGFGGVKRPPSANTPRILMWRGNPRRRRQRSPTGTAGPGMTRCATTIGKVSPAAFHLPRWDSTRIQRPADDQAEGTGACGAGFAKTASLVGASNVRGQIIWRCAVIMQEPSVDKLLRWRLLIATAAAFLTSEEWCRGTVRICSKGNRMFAVVMEARCPNY
jgi:hypothetical protein